LVDAANPFVGISKLHHFQVREMKKVYLNSSVIDHYNQIGNFGVFINSYNCSADSGSMFLMYIGNKIKGVTNLIGKLYLTNSIGST
jgi:hypothetical protein